MIDELIVTSQMTDGSVIGKVDGRIILVCHSKEIPEDKVLASILNTHRVDEEKAKNFLKEYMSARKDIKEGGMITLPSLVLPK